MEYVYVKKEHMITYHILNVKHVIIHVNLALIVYIQNVELVTLLNIDLLRLIKNVNVI